MEVEQPISKFQKTPQAIIAPTSNIETVADTSSFYYKFNSSDKVAKLSKKVISNSYRLIDSISGHPSHIFLDFPSDFAYSELKNILGFLIDNNVVGNYRFSDSRYNDAPHFYRIDIAPKYLPDITDGTKPKIEFAHGFSKNPEEALSKAIGEFLERYFLTVYHKKNLLRSSPSALKSKKLSALNLNLLAGFSDDQKKADSRKQFDEDSVFYWEKVKRISTGETIFVPAQLAYWSYNREETEPYLREGNTSGAGGFFTLEGAILSGLYELIQRDSYLIYWLNKLTPVIIKPETVPHDGFQNILEESKRYGFEIFCLNITSEIGIPAFMAVISDPTNKSPRFSFGIGCDTNPIKAVFRALEESWSIYDWSRKFAKGFFYLNKNFRPFKEQINHIDRVRIWNNPAMAKYLDFFISGKEAAFSEIDFNCPEKFTSEKEELDFLVKRVESFGQGYEVYYYKSFHPILSEIGYYSAKVIVPQLVPFYLNETNAPLNTLRLKEVPKKIGLSSLEPFNPLPQPFS